MEDKTIFDEIDQSDVKPQNIKVSHEEEDSTPEQSGVGFSLDDFSDEAPADKSKRVNCDGKILTIIGVDFTKPKTIDIKTNQVIPPRVSQKNATVKYYPGKFVCKFAEDNVIEYYPGLKYFIQRDGSIGKMPKIPRQGTNVVAKMFLMVAALLNKKPEEVSDRDFLKFFIGKRVLIKADTGVYLGNAYFRNDIASFVDFEQKQLPKA